MRSMSNEELAVARDIELCAINMGVKTNATIASETITSMRVKAGLPIALLTISLSRSSRLSAETLVKEEVIFPQGKLYRGMRLQEQTLRYFLLRKKLPAVA